MSHGRRAPLQLVVTGLAVLAAAPATDSTSSLHVVAIPVTDLRAKPGTFPAPEAYDLEQETQLLYGEQVRVLKTEGAWAFVHAIEQPEWTHNRRWEGYPGWVLKDVLKPIARPLKPNAVVTAKWATVWADAQGVSAEMLLPMGAELVVTNRDGDLWQIRLISGEAAWMSRGSLALLSDLKRLPSERRRQAVLLAAASHIGDPYFWGGRSPSTEAAAAVTGVDCSGLVNLSYRAAGLHIPRDSHEQRLRARRVKTLKPADLIFLSDVGLPDKTVHVMLYAGDGWIIEGPGTGTTVRRIQFAERLGRPLSDIKPGHVIDQRTVYFGAYLQ